MMGKTAVVDGWYAWLVCAASFLVLVVQGGLVYSMGVFYIMFQNALDESDGALSLVTSLNYSVLYLACPFVGILTDKYSERPLAVFGAVLATVGLVCSSFATEVFHLYLAYSLVTGLGFGLVFNPCTSIVGKYFKKYMKTAMGISVCGNGIGSFVFPPIIDALEDAYGWRGALLLVGGIYMHVIVFCCIYRPLPPQPVGPSRTFNAAGENSEVLCKDAEAKEIIASEDTNHMQLAATNGTKDLLVISGEESQSGNKQCKDGSMNGIANGYTAAQPRNTIKKIILLFKSIPFSCLCLHSMLTLFPTVLVYTHLGRYVLTLGYTQGDVVYLYMAIGISTTICRAFIGFGAEVTKVDPTILVMGSAIINGLLTVFLPSFQSLPLMYVYGVIFAIMLAPYNVFCFPMVIDCVPKGQDATAYGIICFACVPSTAFGAPLAAWLYHVTDLYASSFYLAGVLFILSGLIMIPAMCHCGRSGEGTTSSQQTQHATKQGTSC